MNLTVTKLWNSVVGTISNNFAVYQWIDTGRCIGKGKCSSVTRLLSQQKFRRPMKFYAATGCGRYPGVPGLSRSKCVRLFRDRNEFYRSRICFCDYSYAIAFYDRLDTPARFHRASNRCHNHWGNVPMGPQTAFLHEIGRRLIIIASRVACVVSASCSNLTREFKYYSRGLIFF